MLLRSAVPLEGSHQLRKRSRTVGSVHRARRRDASPATLRSERTFSCCARNIASHLPRHLERPGRRRLRSRSHPNTACTRRTDFIDRARGPVGTSPKTATPLSHIIHKGEMAGRSSNVAGQWNGLRECRAPAAATIFASLEGPSTRLNPSWHARSIRRTAAIRRNPGAP